VLAELLPARLAQALAEAHLPLTAMANIPDRALISFAGRLKRWEVRPTESEGWPKAEVTLGGIDTRDLSSKNHGGAQLAGSLCDWRSGRRHRLARRLQFPVGMVERLVRRRGTFFISA